MWQKRSRPQRLSLHNHGNWVAGLLLSLLAYGLAQTPLFDPLEQFYYERVVARLASTERSGKVVMVDSGAVVSQGELAEALGRLHRARAVALMLPLVERENAVALQQLAQLETTPADNKRLAELARGLDGAARLAVGIKQAGNVWLAAYGTPAEAAAGGGESSLSRYLRLPAPPPLPQLGHLSMPLAELLAAARGVGVVLSDEHPSSIPAAVREGEQSRPSLLYRMLPSNLQQQAGEGMAYRYYPRVDTGNASGIPRYLLSDLIGDRVPASSLRGMQVFIGDASRISGYAVALDALLREQQVTLPVWTRWAHYGALLGVALFLMLLLPQLGLTSGLFSFLLLLFVLLNTEALMLLLFSQWLPLLVPTLLLLLGYGLITLQRRVSLREGGLLLELSAANMQLGRMLQSQGELEQAWEKYRRCLAGETLYQQLYNLGLDFERKRQFNKAVALFEELQRMARNFSDVGERLARNREMGDRIVLPQGKAAPGGTVVMQATQGLQRPTLGHYHIEKEIGRGAMGMVYLGQDPRINREVAIKTMALSHEFEGTELKEVKARFYREAETAGRLNHPNIVTIYDIGEEQELAYIAMDYLRGEDLSAYTGKKTLLPLKEVMAVAEQVALALEYAHSQNVVHRDIKPANIIYDRGPRVVKVTDFGVACLTDSNKTRTGTVLGSPSYMSPEQVAGKRVDGRADIFSLGVTLYQLTTAQLPFEAESLGSLMFKVANQPHAKPGKYRSGIPICLTRIINKCLQKEPGKRYQSAAEVAVALKRCRGG
jgi:tetratricopeptide (TPR) repeat protein